MSRFADAIARRTEMSKELSELQKKRQRQHARAEAEHEMAKPHAPRGGKSVARKLAHDKDALKRGDKAARAFRKG
jgi:hypothetical protein